MNRFRLGLIVAVALIVVSYFPVSYVLRKPGQGGTAAFPEPVSYAKPTPDGTAVLVAFGDPEAEGKLKDGETRRYVAEVRAKYPRPGLYRTGDRAELVYPLDGYSPDDQVFLSPDGRHVIRLEGEWWKTKAYPGPKRLPAAAEQAQLDAVAVRHFTDGQVTHEYTLRELVDDPAELPHSPDHILWPAGAVLNRETGQFHLFTQDSVRTTLDAATGAVLARGKTGLGNPITRWVLGVTIALTAGLATVIVWYTFFKTRTPVAEPAGKASG
jgi:hypothetical protein